ncbi:hypothetical protein ACELLULO517_07530 [Acidisoma cellulosilytica]|uniref:Uncharacterized protein n=1 Tax=Acidisoma cellulosilyticum TaxID=2802395 RepID=A0A964E347_9PROT|nr:hypothetical protein [Acidisoma cellulosilyticum]MCB8880081.1 hypothetical protein [Acidisoma cellulosilyticum]
MSLTTTPATSYRQPAADALLARDMAALLAKLERAEDKLMRSLSRKRRVAGQKQINIMADRHEAMREERNRMEARYE